MRNTLRALRPVGLLLFSLSLYSASAAANWYEATGQAPIERGDINAARQAAIADALQRASLFAGAKVQSEQQVIQGILQHHQVTLTSAAELKQVQLLSETHSQNQVSITLRAHIIAETQRCQAQYRTPLQLSTIQLAARQDAIHGQLFQLGEQSTRQLARHLRDFVPAAKLSINEQLMLPAQLTADVADALFAKGQQFVLLASINDLSLGRKVSKFWQSDSHERFFALELWLFDTYQREFRFQQEYRTASYWPARPDTPAPHSMAFWQMPLGQKIDQVLRAVALDIQQQLQCEPLLTQIRQVRQQQIEIGLGSSHGLQVGQQVQLIQVQRDPEDSRIRRLLHSPVKLTLTEVNPDSAWAAATAQQLLNHIQPGDIVSLAGQ
jgi:flavin-binding protein dodecin